MAAPEITLAPRKFSKGSYLWIATALVIAIAATFLAYNQRPYPYPLQERSWSDWFLYPTEKNAFARLQYIPANLNDVFALPGTNKVWAVGDNGMIVHSDDGGLTWEQQPKPETEQAQTQATLDLPDLVQPAYAADAADEYDPKEFEPQAFETKKEQPKRPPPDQQPQQTRAPTRAPIPDTPEPAQPPEPAPQSPDKSITADLYAVHFVSPTRGWAAGAGGTIVTTTDAGTSWTPQTSGISAALRAVHFVSTTQGWAVGQNGTILTTTDAGTSWTPQTSGISAALRAVHFASPTQGWAVGGAGTILTTTDGGVIWMPQTRGSYAELTAVHFVSPTQGWAVGGAGTILTTSDAGTTWTPQSSGTSAWLNAVHFVSPTQGWVVGSNGTILTTQDAGDTWTSQTSTASAWLRAVHFVSPTQGWAVGGAGTILTTTDGGVTWMPQTRGSYAELTAVHFVSPTQGWAVGGAGTILTTSDAGTTWTPQSSPTISDLHDVYFVSPTQGWVVGQGLLPVDGEGTILVTSDAGENWTGRQVNDKSWFSAVYFVSPTRGWIVGGDPLVQTADGAIFTTSDAGETWTSQELPLQTSSFVDVHFFSSTQGWVTDGSTILTTNDAGATWTPQTSNTSASLEAVHFVSASRGWVVGGDGTILMTTDAGTTWAPQISNTSASLEAVHFVSASRGWVVGGDGTILMTTDAGTTWAPQISGTATRLNAVHFVSPTQGWAVGTDGTILTTADAGTSWTNVKYEAGFAPWYYTLLLFIPLSFGLVFYQQHRQLQQQDSTRFDKKRPLLDDDPADSDEQPASIADQFASDQPLQAGDPDPLAFQSIAQGISRFLRNEKTTPPLTIAVTGEWGTGKSSLMNLLQADLKRYRYRPVWFNAWHHQKEEHMLAALLENIRLQAIPPWWHWRAWWFRARLLWLRGWRNWVPISALFFIFLVAMSYAASEFRTQWILEEQQFKPALEATSKELREAFDDVSAEVKKVVTGLQPEQKNDNETLIAAVQSLTLELGELTQQLTTPQAADVREQADKEKQENAPSSEMKTANTPPHQPGLLFLLSSALSVLSFFFLALGAVRNFPMFGRSPAALLAAASKNARIRDFKAQTGFRQRFATEFYEVTTALEPRTMLILIDDLDRCRPEQVLEILETVNFLVSSGKCFVVIGMALERVKRCVGLGFKDVAEEFIDSQAQETQQPLEATNGAPVQAETADADQTATSDTEAAKRKRAKFAQDYLEKLVNIEVPVPVLTVKQAKSMAAAEAEDGQQTDQEKQLENARKRREKRYQRLRFFSPFVFAAGVILCAVVLGWRLHGDEPTATPDQQQVSTDIVQTDQTSATRSDQVTGQEDNELADRSQSDQNRLAKISPVVQESRNILFPISIFVGLTLVSLWWLLSQMKLLEQLQPTPLRPTDSKEFQAALRIWLPLVVEKKQTPRTVKRFVNHVRYLAMLQAEEEEPPLWQQCKSWFTGETVQAPAWPRMQSWLQRSPLPVPAVSQQTPTQQIPESLLVALDSIHYSHDEYFDDQHHFDTFITDFFQPASQNGADGAVQNGAGLDTPSDPSEEEKLRQAFAACVSDHEQALLNSQHEIKDPPQSMVNHLATFLRMTEGVRMSSIGRDV